MSSGDSRERQQTEQESASDPVLDLLPGYVLGVLDRDEQLEVEAGLALSPEVRAEFERYLRAVDSLNESIPLADPPGSLQARITSSTNTQAALEPISIRRSRVPVLLAAAAVVVLVLGGAVALLIGEVRDRDDRIASLEASTAQRASTDFTQPLVWSPISGGTASSPATGYFCRTEDGGVGWIIVDGMRTGENQILQLWLVDGDRVVNGGTFATDEAGRGFGVVRVDVPVHTFSQIWITVEPSGGSPGPTSEPDVKAPIV